jgi:alkylation response protein AidB-like acyl-CoA dehydrogenase
MDFELSDDQKMLVDTAASFARKDSPVQRMRRLRDHAIGYEPAVWRQMGELGWLGIAFPEAMGGFGGRFIDVALVLEQFGTTLVPEPYIPSVVLAGMAILRAGTGEQQARWLAPMIEGKTTLALAYAERHARYDVTAPATRALAGGREGHDGYELWGEKIFVLNGHHADSIVVSAAVDGGVGLFVIERDTPGLEIRPVKTMDGQRAAMLVFQGARVERDRMLGEPGAATAEVLEAVMDLGAAAACAEGLGIARAVLDMTVGYLGTREQFGVEIGTFQVLQHRAVDMFIEVELCRSMMILAGLEADNPDPEQRRSAISAAKVQLDRGGRHVVRQGVQLHGGIGCTDEHDVSLYFKRMQVLGALFGDEAHHVARFARLPAFTAGLESHDRPHDRPQDREELRELRDR